tara:strand:- start:5301 stop:5690 length:390 start_codon:yes stop_codon:yes gene_type:complete
MKNIEVIGLAECLNALCDNGVNLRPKTWYTLANNRQTLINQGKIIDEGIKNIQEKYKETNEEGKDIIPETSVPDFHADRNELMEMEVELSFYQIDMKDIEKDMPKMKGVKNLYIFFDYIVSSSKELQEA